MKWKKNVVLLFIILAGVIIGALLATLTTEIPMLSWLGYGKSVGIDVGNPFILDLSIIRIAFGFEMGVNVAQIICILLGLLGYRALVKRL